MLWDGGWYGGYGVEIKTVGNDINAWEVWNMVSGMHPKNKSTYIGQRIIYLKVIILMFPCKKEWFLKKKLFYPRILWWE